MQQKNGSKCIHYINDKNFSAPKNDLKSFSQYFDLKNRLLIMAVKRSYKIKDCQKIINKIHDRRSMILNLSVSAQLTACLRDMARHFKTETTETVLCSVLFWDTDTRNAI
jgi:hypothetical protein